MYISHMRSAIEKDAGIVQSAGRLVLGMKNLYHKPFRTILKSFKPGLPMTHRPRAVIRELKSAGKWGGGIAGAGILASQFMPNQRPI